MQHKARKRVASSFPSPFMALSLTTLLWVGTPARICGAEVLVGEGISEMPPKAHILENSKLEFQSPLK
jgi:hypothetical protein